MTRPGSSMGTHILAGGSHPTAVGQALRHAAKEQSLPHHYIDYDFENRAPRLLRAFCWKVLGHRPAGLHRFNKRVLEQSHESKASWVHCAGNLALTATSLQVLKKGGTRSTIWLTDDPWNPGNRSRWVMEALSCYDLIFTPRRANLEQLEKLAPGRVAWLPFGYDPRYFHPVADPGPFLHDVLFAGGADRDRASFFKPLLETHLNVGLYGAYWDRFGETRQAFCGYAAPEKLASLVGRSKVCVCIVRQANRDGHCMRTFELAAAGACIVAEDTPEHRAIFGPEGKAAAYFTHGEAAAILCKKLASLPEDRQRMAQNARELMANGRHTYSDRLSFLLNSCNTSAPPR